MTSRIKPDSRRLDEANRLQLRNSMTQACIIKLVNSKTCIKYAAILAVYNSQSYIIYYLLTISGIAIYVVSSNRGLWEERFVFLSRL